MVAINFQPEFADLVASGWKLQTIRKSARCKVGDELQLYTGQRTKQCRKLADAICIEIGKIEIASAYLMIGSTIYSCIEANEFAQRDGFKDYEEMYKWFSNTYGYPYFVGKFIKWKLRNDYRENEK